MTVDDPKDFQLKELPADWPEHNFQSFSAPESVSSYASSESIFPAEAAIFSKYAAILADASVLDIGVGGGRTTQFLINQCRAYKAVDYSPSMIEACRKRFPAATAETFSVCDARNMPAEPSAGYDFVLFSYNGIDSVAGGDRESIFLEVRRVLKDGGYFVFSTHSLHAFPFADQEVNDKNKHVTEDDLKRGWCHLIDYDGRVVLYYSYPALQKKVLEGLGFEVEEILDYNGSTFDLDNPPSDWMVNFICRGR
jgi:SAM-dependent methyltransferase